MRQRYPKVNNCLIFRRRGQDEFDCVNFIDDEEYRVGTEAVRYMMQLDGKTHPYSIPVDFTREEIRELNSKLLEYGLIRKGTVRKIDFGTYLKTVWEIKVTDRLYRIASLWNKLLLFSFLPVLILGLVVSNYVSQNCYLGFDYFWIGYPIGLLSAFVLHELGHAFAGISYHARVFEAGLLVKYYIMLGAYVILDEKPVKKRLHRLQISAAGIETNFLLGGLFLLGGAIFPSVYYMFLLASLTNIMIGGVNLLFISGLDGYVMMLKLLGVDEIDDKVDEMITRRKTRQKLMQKGTGGYALGVVSCILRAARTIALPLYLLFSVVGLIDSII